MPGDSPPPNWLHNKSLSFGDTKLNYDDLKLLWSPNWINDNLISFWTEYLMDRQFPELKDKGAVLLSPQVVQLLHSLPSNDMKDVLQGYEMETKNLWAFPINDCEVEVGGGTHWSLLVYWKGRNFIHYDSSKYYNLIKAQELAVKLAKAYSLENWGKMEFEGCLPQENGHDCGIHVMCNMRAACQQLLTPSLTVNELVTRQVIRGAREEIIQIVRKLMEEQTS